MKKTLAPKNKTPMGKPKKLALWIGGSIVGLFAIILIIGSIGIASTPGGWEAVRAEQAAAASAKADKKAAAAQSKVEEEAAAEQAKAAEEADEQQAKADEETAQAEQEAATASQEAAKSEAEKTAIEEQEAAQVKAQEAESALAEIEQAETAKKDAKAAKEAEAKSKTEQVAADKQAKADAKQQKIDAANKWWFEDKGSLLTQHINTLKGFTDAAIGEDIGGMISECAAMQEQTKFMGQRSIDRVSRPTEFGDDVADRFDSASVAFRDAAKGCKAVLDDGELTRADQAGEDVARAQYGFQSVKDDVYGEYIEIK